MIIWLVGCGRTSDIAAMLGVTRQTVDHRYREDLRFPAPIGVINRSGRHPGYLVWMLDDVKRWDAAVHPAT